MEMGCSSMTESGGSSSSSPPNSSTESLNGLKFGQKIYFEDVGPGTPSKSGAGSSSSGPCSGAGPSKKVKAGFVQTVQPPRCQVEGCKVDLSDAKAYYSRHKVCGMHSKTPKVIVAGLEQRFCQQCSRFHQLPEFDQGKRSCRRRLAGHNERRRKPPPGSLLSTRYGRLSTPIFENGNRVGVGVGSFLMDFSAYPRLAGRDPWTLTRTSEQVPGNQSTNTAVKLLPNLWQSNSESPPSDLFLQGSAGGSSFPGQGIASGECISGVTDSSCALSLLSNQPWASRDRPSGLVVHSSVNAEGVPVVQPTAPHGGTVNHFLTTSWGFKDNVTSSSSQEILPNLGLGQMLQPLTVQFPGEVELSQHNRRQFMELGHSRDYNSAGQNMPWSL